MPGEIAVSSTPHRSTSTNYVIVNGKEYTRDESTAVGGLHRSLVKEKSILPSDATEVIDKSSSQQQHQIKRTKSKQKTTMTSTSDRAELSKSFSQSTVQSSTEGNKLNQRPTNTDDIVNQAVLRENSTPSTPKILKQSDQSHSEQMIDVSKHNQPGRKESKKVVLTNTVLTKLTEGILLSDNIDKTFDNPTIADQRVRDSFKESEAPKALPKTSTAVEATPTIKIHTTEEPTTPLPPRESLATITTKSNQTATTTTSATKPENLQISYQKEIVYEWDENGTRTIKSEFSKIFPKTSPNNTKEELYKRFSVPTLTTQSNQKVRDQGTKGKDRPSSLVINNMIRLNSKGNRPPPVVPKPGKSKSTELNSNLCPDPAIESLYASVLKKKDRSTPSTPVSPLTPTDTEAVLTKHTSVVPECASDTPKIHSAKSIEAIYTTPPFALEKNDKSKFPSSPVTKSPISPSPVTPIQREPVYDSISEETKALILQRASASKEKNVSKTTLSEKIFDFSTLKNDGNDTKATALTNDSTQKANEMDTKLNGDSTRNNDTTASDHATHEVVKDRPPYGKQTQYESIDNVITFGQEEPISPNEEPELYSFDLNDATSIRSDDTSVFPYGAKPQQQHHHEHKRNGLSLGALFQRKKQKSKYNISHHGHKQSDQGNNEQLHEQFTRSNSTENALIDAPLPRIVVVKIEDANPSSYSDSFPMIAHRRETAGGQYYNSADNLTCNPNSGENIYDDASKYDSQFISSDNNNNNNNIYKNIETGKQQQNMDKKKKEKGFRRFRSLFVSSPQKSTKRSLSLLTPNKNMKRNKTTTEHKTTTDQTSYEYFSQQRQDYFKDKIQTYDC